MKRYRDAAYTGFYRVLFDEGRDLRSPEWRVVLRGRDLGALLGLASLGASLLLWWRGRA